MALLIACFANGSVTELGNVETAPRQGQEFMYGGLAQGTIERVAQDSDGSIRIYLPGNGLAGLAGRGASDGNRTFHEGATVTVIEIPSLEKFQTDPLPNQEIRA